MCTKLVKQIVISHMCCFKKLKLNSPNYIKPMMAITVWWVSAWSIFFYN